jgi:hypothetical protein
MIKTMIVAMLISPHSLKFLAGAHVQERGGKKQNRC